MDSDECETTVHPTASTAAATTAMEMATTALKLACTSCSSTKTATKATKAEVEPEPGPEADDDADADCKLIPHHHHLQPWTYQLEPVKWQQQTQRMLNKTLGPEFISNRSGPSGSKLTYIEGWKVINLANEIFGFNGWYSSVKELTVDYIDFVEKTERYNVSASAIIHVRMPDGAYHEDVGCGSAENQKTKSIALEKAKKEAVTDGTKRALRNFGKVMGNCMYDKHYIAEIEKMGKTKPKIDFKNIYRPAYDAEMEEKARKKAEENENENTPVQDNKKTIKGASATPAPMRAPALPARATTVSGTKALPAAPTRAPLAPMQTNRTPVPQPQKPMVKGGSPPSDPYSAEDAHALEGMDLDASTYLGGRTNAMQEGDSGFSAGGLFDSIAEVNVGNNAGGNGPQGATSTVPDQAVRRTLNEEDEAQKKRVRSEELERKRQAALLRQQQKSTNQQQQQQRHRSPPSAGGVGLQRSKTAGNPSTNTAKPIAVQAGTLPTLNVGAGGMKSAPGSSESLAAARETFVSARTIKRTLIDEPYETVFTHGVSSRPTQTDPSKRPRPA
ncbi:BQ2448_6798 [Microbotryum intermedium]|uniref:BQ2448_6798 protein n=1 Tax=Microbotryum intermedium TaxID=269621 RepID=A0A238FTE3_9BASI|nr:BQ2448_6798 [Microbotryum intermedium]